MQTVYPGWIQTELNSVPSPSCFFFFCLDLEGSKLPKGVSLSVSVHVGAEETPPSCKGQAWMDRNIMNPTITSCA